MSRPLPHRPPRQSRSERTLERIVRASLDILADEGPAALTVQAIVERAGSSVGSFYARFEGKDELLDYLGERVWREAAERWDRALAERDWSGLDAAALIDGAVRLLGEAGRTRATYLRALERAPGARDDAYASFQAHVASGLETLLLARRDDVAHPEPEVAVRLGLRAVLGVLDDAEPARGGALGEGAGSQGRAPVPLERRAEEAARLLRAYLLGGGGEGEATGEVDFFDVWG